MTDQRAAVSEGLAALLVTRFEADNPVYPNPDLDLGS
jgi:hypothetical protein